MPVQGFVAGVWYVLGSQKNQYESLRVGLSYWGALGTGVKHRRGVSFQHPGFYTAVVFRCALEQEEAGVRR